MEFLIKNPDIKHGKIRVGFTPDEEMDVAHFDVRNLELTGRIPWMEVKWRIRMRLEKLFFKGKRASWLPPKEKSTLC
jgi:hypothetical protein